MTNAGSDPSPSELIDGRIAELGDWRGEMLARIRRLIKQAEPEVVEEWKWRGVPTWYRGGMICTGETYKDKVKVTFAKGASLPDPAGLFNASLTGNVRRAIDVHEGGELDDVAFEDLVRAAVRENTPEDDGPRLLSGGNPQIPKGDGDAPVQAYLDAMPGWKQDVGRQLDGLIERTVPEVKRAVRWNSPFYGVEGLGWFLSYHCFTRYIKVTFFRGSSLDPVPPEESKDGETRYFHIHEDDEIDEALLGGWIEQAARLRGWEGF